MILAGKSFTEGMDAFEGLSPQVRLSWVSLLTMVVLVEPFLTGLCGRCYSKYRSMSARLRKARRARILLRQAKTCLCQPACIISSLSGAEQPRCRV